MSKEYDVEKSQLSKKEVPENQVSNEKIASAIKADCFFPFFDEERFLVHPNRDVLSKLAGPDNTISHVNKAMSELNILHKVSISRVMPTKDQQWRIIPLTGIASRTISPERVELLFDPDNKNTMDSLSTWSGRQIAHELNHVARLRLFSLHTTLLDALISEGLATFYEEHSQNNYLVSHWGHVLSDEQLKIEWTKAQEKLLSTDYNFADWFYGRQDGHPIYTGYSLGVAIVSQLFNLYPNLPIAEAIQKPSMDILKESKFA